MAVQTEFGSLDELDAVPLEALTVFTDEQGRHHFADPARLHKRVAGEYVLVEAVRFRP